MAKNKIEVIVTGPSASGKTLLITFLESISEKKFISMSDMDKWDVFCDLKTEFVFVEINNDKEG